MTPRGVMTASAHSPISSFPACAPSTHLAYFYLKTFVVPSAQKSTPQISNRLRGLRLQCYLLRDLPWSSDRKRSPHPFIVSSQHPVHFLLSIYKLCFPSLFSASHSPFPKSKIQDKVLCLVPTVSPVSRRAGTQWCSVNKWMNKEPSRNDKPKASARSVNSLL